MYRGSDAVRVCKNAELRKLAILVSQLLSLQILRSNTKHHCLKAKCKS